VTAYALYILFALGAIGLYCLMPRKDKPPAFVGGSIGGAAVIGLLILFATRVPLGGGHTAYFCLFATIAIVGAVKVITHSKPVYSALYFVLVVLAVAPMLVLLSAEFLAVALIIVYAGAILITYLFVIMLAQQSGQPLYDLRSREPFLAVVAGFALTAGIAGNVDRLTVGTGPRIMLTAAGPGQEPPPIEIPSELDKQQRESDRELINRLEEKRLLGGAIIDGPPAAVVPAGSPAGETTQVSAAIEAAPAGAAPSTAKSAGPGNTLLIGREVMTRYVVVLEMSGVLLLIAMVGAIALSRKRIPTEVQPEPQPALGEIGRQVGPY
jgi:NADH-quinone oxidoreductase subunit J